MRYAWDRVPVLHSVVKVMLRLRVQNASYDDAVGAPLVASQSGTGVAVTFYILSGNTTVFKIGMCNGQIRINNPLLDYHQQSVYTLLVQAQSNALATSATNATITVNVLNVPHPPVFLSPTCTLSVDELLPANTAIPPAVGAYDIDGRNVTYAIDPYTSGAAYVSVNRTTGQCWRCVSRVSV